MIGIKYGTHYSPNNYSIICSHFDSYCFTDTLNASGADDNASGTSAVFECARVLKDYKFEYTIRFVAFSDEEFGLYGSETYADFARIMNDKIIVVVNADMIGYTNEFPDTLEVYADNYGTPSEALADFFIECAENYTSLLCLKKLIPSIFSSDPQRDAIQYLILIGETLTFTSPESILTSIFLSDTIVKYQLITPISHGNVYFWKFKAKDPYGTNYWSLFSDVRSFTIDTTLSYNTCSFLQRNFNQFSKNNLINLKIVGDSVLLETYGYIEDFEGFFPQNWGINDGNNDGIYWSNGVSIYLGIYTPPNYHSKYAYYDDYPAGYTNNSAEEIISPPVYISAGSTNIKVIYDYGIKCLESDEKIILKTRKFNSGLWSPWINRYTHYLSSFGNFSYLIPSNYFHLESLQVK